MTKPARLVRKRSVNTAHHDEAFLLLMARFDRVDKDNSDIKKSVSEHIKDDLKVARVVEQHSTYWGLLIAIGTPALLAVIAWFKGLFD